MLMKDKRIAVLVVKKIKKKPHICLVTGRTTKSWIPPTGKYERKLSTSQVAELEAFEEAGVIGKLDQKFHIKTTAKSPNGKKKRKVLLYRMWATKVFKHWPEEDERKRVWIKPDKLGKKLNDRKLAKELEKYC